MPVGPPKDITLWRFFLTQVPYMMNFGGASMDKDYLLKKALYLTKKGLYKNALRCFKEEPDLTLKPAAMSYYALCVAFVKKDYENAISLCVAALKREFYNPEIYANLGRILAVSGQKAFALRAFRKGLRIDDTHCGLMKELRAMGVRRKPLLSFLPRENPINKFFGILTNNRFNLRFKTRQDEQVKLSRSRYY
jgi:tetratricopeptide (TPR) repeat protein